MLAARRLRHFVTAALGIVALALVARAGTLPLPPAVHGLQMLAEGGPHPSPSDEDTELVRDIEVHPEHPRVGDPVSVEVSGRFPFDCGFVASSGAEGPDLGVTLGRSGNCNDGGGRWEQTFSLGTPAAGDHVQNVRVHIPVLGIDRAFPFQFHVAAANEPPGPHDPPDPDDPPHPGNPPHPDDPPHPGNPPDPDDPPDDSLFAGLSAIAPNPFHDQAKFNVSIAQPAQAEVAVFDLGGRRVAILHRGPLPTGTTTFGWNGRRTDGSRAPGGIYFYRLTVPNRVVTRRMVLLGLP